MFDWQTTWADMLLRLEQEGWQDWSEVIKQQLQRRFVENPHGDLPRWQAALDQLPERQDAIAYNDRSEVTVDSLVPLSSPETEQLAKGLRGLIPWRKGPFRFFGTLVDTEWRSDWKWDRVAPALSNLEGRRVLDVGCGSGYHLWRMYGAGAAEVIGIDPGLLFLCQFLAVKRYQPAAPVDLLPLRIEDLARPLEYFDTTFSMGVLYHRATDWMQFQSLEHFLDPDDPSLTVEGYPGPRRATVIARKPG